MSIEIATKWGVAIGISIWVITMLSNWLERHRSKDEKREVKIDDLIAAQLTQHTAYSREDYLRIEKKVEAFEKKIESKFETILVRLGAMAQRDAVLSAEINSWPSHLKRVDLIAHDVARNRDGLNEVRIKAGLPPIDQTPPMGNPVMRHPSAHDVGRPPGVPLHNPNEKDRENE